MASGRSTSTKADGHVCTPPKGFALEHGLLWICPDCWSEFIYRPVACRELAGRVLNLWVRHYEPPVRRYIAPGRRNRERKRAEGGGRGARQRVVTEN